MDLGFVNKQGLSALCRKYDVRILDRTHFLPLGVPTAKSGGRLSRAREARRDYLKDIGCGQKPLRFKRTDGRSSDDIQFQAVRSFASAGAYLCAISVKV